MLEEFSERRPIGDEPEVLTLTERNGFVSQTSRFNKRLAVENTESYKHISKGDIAFNPYLLWAGAIAQNRHWDSAIISPLYPTFHVRDGYDSNFVIHLLLSDLMIKHYDTVAFGSVPRRRRTSVNDFLALELPSPPGIEEQLRIAKALDQAVEGQTKRRKAIALLNDLAESIFYDTFGDLSASLQDWSVETFKTQTIEPPRNGLSPSKAGKIEARVLTLSAVTGAAFDGSAAKISTFVAPPPSSKAIDRRDFLVCRGSGNLALVGRGFFPDADMPDTTFPDTMIAVRVAPERLGREYLEYVWRTDFIRRQIESGARTTNGTYKINQRVLEAIRLPVPPREIQEDFGCRIQKIDGIKRVQLRHLGGLAELLNSLQWRAFRGEL
jgi:type I restriction enzyme S subunit